MAAKPAGKLPASPTKSTAVPPGASTPTPRKRVDWQAVERDYRTGNFTLREMEERHGPSNTTILRRAKKDGWTQDLSEAIKQATNAKVIAAIVQQECSAAQQDAAISVLAAAEVNSRVIIKHRKGLSRLDRVKEKLLDQIEQAAEQLPELVQVIEMVRNPDENGVDRANDAMRKAMSRTALVDDLKKLAEIDERVRKGEREAHNIPATGTPDADKEARPKKRYVLDFVDVEPRHD